MAERIVFTAKGRVAVESYEPGDPKEGEVRVRGLASLVSAGTELTILNADYAPGSHWDQWIQGRWPWYPGYALVGDIEAVGPGVTEWRPGDRVALRAPHASHCVAGAGDCLPAPRDLPPEDAVWFALAKIAFMSAKAARYFLGDSVLVIGAGPIGQMAVRWARAAGCERIAVVDPMAPRHALARAGGATATIATPLADARAEVEAACSGPPQVVVDATGRADVFARALDLAAPRGRVVILGDTGHPAEQRLSSDVIGKGLCIVGAHDTHDEPPWTAARITRLFFALALDGRLPLAGLTTHLIAPAETPDAYARMTQREAGRVGTVIRWS